MRYDAEHKQRTRTKVLQAAAKAIRSEGPHRVGVAGVMADAGLTHGGFYAHFASKDELVAAAIGHMFEESAARMREATEGHDTAAGLAAYIDFYLSEAHRDMRGAGCPMAALASDLPRLPDAARGQFADGVQRSTATLGAKLASLGRADAETLARSVIAELIGALALARAETAPDRSAAILDASRRQLKRRLGLEHAA
jgi:TetR/AcrR family transcriptional repressor of nem operon